MTNRGFSDDGTIDDLPWASVFDPAANARALSAIQAEGFRAASRIVDRFVRAVGSNTNSEAAPTPAGTGATNGNAAVSANGDVDGIQEFERLTRAWWSMVGQFLLRSMPVNAKTGSEVVSLDVSNPDSKRAVNLEAGVGGSATTEVWLHNRGPDDRGDVRLQCSDLLSHEGNVIRADAVRMDTAVVPMSPRTSRGVAIAIDVAPEVRPGVYRGTLLASGHPDLWLPVVLTVRLPST
ncbi:MAG: hypothetical protein QOJ56_2726 [Mycobacterium sp.]|nr:hypothetical protein [Mycobacterium sp.]MDT7722673.1 hypothetical protein [Mycobacterium sp.]